MTAKINSNSALKAIRELRRKKLRQGIPFMINSDILETDQCYLEFPDGTIKIVEANTRGRDFEVVWELTLNEANILRRRLKLA